MTTETKSIPESKSVQRRKAARAKPEAPTPAPRNQATEVATLINEVARLKALIAKMAHYTGTESLLIEFGIERFKPGKKDMTKFK